jgi:hypothetical protein
MSKEKTDNLAKLVGLNEILGDLRNQINSPKVIISKPDFRKIEYNCWCCEDSGKIVNHLVKMIHPEYDYWRHLYYACQASHCYALMQYWSKLLDQFNFDLTSEICDRLHYTRKHNYELWWESKPSKNQ